ncbi:MAG: DNA topoisomerase I [Gammaproteobacteria bacterium]|nr:MAG: DNA topoisomerase I [Gammaproteobacteria bacterium]
MSKNLVIVESPAKAKTIEKYLGQDFQVMASYGHVRDLVPKGGAVDTEHDFEMRYEVIERNQKHVDAIARAVKKCDTIYLATDPDREGEAISWHLYEILRERNLLNGKPVHRVVFYEITRDAVRRAIAEPRDISTERVNAQQARRALDYLVGFNLSPLLWKKVRRGLSAGRVQSPALRMICEREAEIDAFIPREYWTLEADTLREDHAFTARLWEYRGERVEQFSFGDIDGARAAREHLLAAAGAGDLPGDGGELQGAPAPGRPGTLKVVRVERKQRRRNPAAPFTTSTLQQEASRKLGFSASRTMSVAQRLYEGIDTDEGAVGLITYMRTDSVSLSNEALAQARELIESRYGAENLPEQPRVYKTTAKNAQEAHEAIRPTSLKRTPEALQGRLTSDQLKLYTLIWKRTVACQMIHATFDTVAVDLLAGRDGDGRSSFRATGSVLRHPGFMAVYQEGQDDAKSGEDGDRILPDMAEGDEIQLRDVRADQHFTEPPPRFSEASLVKALEEYGIGRPSTYASIISTLQQREYVEMDARRFIPTDVGKIVNKFLTQHFSQYVDYEFTARLEDSLDEVFRGERDWVPLMREFWEDFHKLVEHKEVSVTRAEAVQARALGTDPKTGRPVSVRMGRFGPIVQIGTREDEEKPLFAGLRPGQKMDDIDLAEALVLFRLPRDLGETPEGEPVLVNIGRFGPYVKYGSKYVSIPADDDPYTISLPRALELVAEKKQADANRIIREFDSGISVLNGRYGPYVTDGKKNAKIPKDVEPASLGLADCEKLLAEAPERRGRGAARKGAGATPAAAKKTAAKKKATAKKATSKKASKKKAVRKKATGKKTVAKKATGKKAAAKKAASKPSTRKTAGEAATAKQDGGAGSGARTGGAGAGVG